MVTPSFPLYCTTRSPPCIFGWRCTSYWSKGGSSSPTDNEVPERQTESSSRSRCSITRCFDQGVSCAFAEVSIKKFNPITRNFLWITLGQARARRGHKFTISSCFNAFVCDVKEKITLQPSSKPGSMKKPVCMMLERGNSRNRQCTLILLIVFSCWPRCTNWRIIWSRRCI